MKPKNCVQTGFSLIEVLTYAGIFAIILAILSGFLVWIYRSTLKAQAIRTVTENSGLALQEITYEIRQAKSIYTPTTALSQLSLETSNYLPEDESSTFLDFFLCQEKICLKKEGQEPIALTSPQVRVKKLIFSQIATSSTIPSIQVVLNIEYKNSLGLGQEKIETSATTTISLRSY